MLSYYIAIPTALVTCLLFPQTEHDATHTRNFSEASEESVVKVSVIGDPNAGKSTLINSILGRRVSPSYVSLGCLVLLVSTKGDTRYCTHYCRHPPLSSASNDYDYFADFIKTASDLLH